MQYGLKCIDLYPHVNGFTIDELGGPLFRNSNVYFSGMINECFVLKSVGL